MATVAPVSTQPFETSLDVVVTTWAPLAADDAGGEVRLAVYSDRSIQVAGEFGGASVTVAGSNDGIEWHALSGTDGAPLVFTSGGLRAIVELPVFIKPRVFGGDGSTSLRVVMSGRKSI